MRHLCVVLFTIACLALCTLSFAKEKNHLPLPLQITSAKSIYIDNQSGIAKLGDRAYEQLTKWGRWQVVTDRQKADLILLLSAHQYNGGYVTSGGGTTGRIDDFGNINTTNEPTYTRPVTVNYTYITVVDPKTGDNLWSDAKRWGNLYNGFHSATKGLVDELMKRINEEEKK
jgi:hypothetical protein